MSSMLLSLGSCNNNNNNDNNEKIFSRCIFQCCVQMHHPNTALFMILITKLTTFIRKSYCTKFLLTLRILQLTHLITYVFISVYISNKEHMLMAIFIKDDYDDGMDWVCSELF